MREIAFISMARKDEEQVRLILDQMDEVGLSYWVYFRDIKAGRNWRILAREALTNTSYVIVFLSHNALASINVRVEVYLARCYGKRIIPILLSECSNELKTLDEINWLINHRIISFDNDVRLVVEQIFKRINDQYKLEPLNTDRIFITYDQEDYNFSSSLANSLKTIGTTVWFDEWSIHVGENIFESRNKGLMRATYLVVCLSFASLSNDQVKRDIQLALSREIPIIPVLTQDESSLPISELSLAVATDELTKDILDINWIRFTENQELTLDKFREALRLLTPEIKQKQGIFISYRRIDTAAESGRLYDRICMKFSKTSVYKDVMNIPPGVDFGAHISSYISQCAVVLILIGQQWISVTDENGNRRIDSPNDFVRLEAEMALSAENTLAIPIMIGDTPMPREEDLPESLRTLARLNGYRVRQDPDFHSDVDKLIEYIENI